MVKTILSRKESDTLKIAKDFLKKLKLGNRAEVVGLYGDLGTGKTAFTKLIAKLLGVKEKVSSPTFVIIKKYSLNKGKHQVLYHLDAYRLKNEMELLHLGWEEIIKDKKNLVFIEWPELVHKAMPKHHKIKISHYKNDSRKFTI